MVTALVILALLLVASLVVWIGAGDVIMARRYASAGALDAAPPPFLILPIVNGGMGESAATAAEPVPVPAGFERSFEPWRSPPRSHSHATPPLAVYEPPVEEWAKPDISPAPVTSDRTATPEPAPDATILFRRPLDEPMQLLPGRFEVVAGEPGREDIRFVGGLGEEARITIGREGGPAHRTVRLRSPTVSRRHARLAFSGGRWSLVNLSRTNPVLINGAVAPSDGEEPAVLEDGDRVEMGEVVLRFRIR